MQSLHTSQSVTTDVTILFSRSDICKYFLKRRDTPDLNVTIGILQKSHTIAEFSQKKI